MKLSALINEIRESYPEADNAKVANLVITEALASDDPSNLLFPAVHAFVITTERSRVRGNEHKAAKWSAPDPGPVFKSAPKTASMTDVAAREKEVFPVPSGKSSDAPAVPSPESYVKPGSDDDPAVAARRALLRDTVFVPGQGRIAWGDLTIEDHEARIAFLQDRISGHEATIARHADAIDVLRKSGAETLDEYYTPSVEDAAA